MKAPGFDLHLVFDASLLKGIAFFSILCALVVASCRIDDDPLPVPIRSASEAMATFQLASGLRIELVAAEPLVEEPVVIQFDEDGRLWVVEMRGFMPNVEGEGEEAPVGRVVVLEDEDGDGEMDQRTVFLDSLVMPRAIAFVPGGVLIAEAKPLWYLEDLNNDLVPEKRILIDSTYGGRGLPEHSPNGLWRGLDNWYYNAKSHYRYRPSTDGWIRDSTEFRGQWGLSHDDTGRLFYNYNWSQLHADLVPPNALMRNPHHTATSGIDEGLATDRRIFPIRATPAVNRGYIEGSLDEQGRLREFTSASSPFIYRGKALADDFYGNAFVAESAGNLVKRNIVTRQGLGLTSRFAYEDHEFLASTDERFRPVNFTSGPDGALYIADMYRGIIQHGAYMTPYLKEQTLNRGLDKGIHYGRIWRIVPDDGIDVAPIRLSEASTSQLVDLLGHPDGWYRDTAQRLVVEQNDPAASTLLKELARTGASHIARLHALWTLEGMETSDVFLYLDALNDPHPDVRSAAMRLLEPAAQREAQVRKALGVHLEKQWATEPAEVALQMALTSAYLEDQHALPILTGIINKYTDQAVIRDAVMSSLYDREAPFLEHLWTDASWQVADPSRSIFLEMVAAAVTRKAGHSELRTLLALAGTEADGWRGRAILTGMSMQAANYAGVPVRLAAAPAVLKNDTWNGIVPLFTWPGHTPVEETISDALPLTENELQLFAMGRQRYVAVCAGCHGNDGAGIRRFAPPLVDSEWVLGDERRLVRILLHGLEGPITVGGQLYDAPEILPVMPSHSVMDDTEMASVLTYIRRAWGHTAAPVEPRTVGGIRHTSQGQTAPWTPETLLNLPLD